MSGIVLQIRNMPVEIHRQLKVRAAVECMSMSDYVLREIRKALDQPTRQEILDRLEIRSVRKLQNSVAATIRAERDSN